MNKERETPVGVNRRRLATTQWPTLFSYLEHLLDLLPRQVDIELVEELQHLADAQAAVAVLIGFREGLFEPPGDTSGQGKAQRDRPRRRRRSSVHRGRTAGKGYWSRVRCLLAKLSSSLMPAIKYFRPVIQVRASSPAPDTRSRDSMCSP